MGADLGFFAENRECDFSELNKCPDCETFFADANCPLCGKECPEQFRAGNRKPIKQKRHRRPSGNGRVQFVPWYHTVWFIVLMLIVQPIVGIILTWSGVWKTHWKVIATILVSVILGVLAKTAPQMNMFVVGFQLKIFTGFAVIFVTLQFLPTVTNYVYEQMQLVIEQIMNVFMVS